VIFPGLDGQPGSYGRYTFVVISKVFSPLHCDFAMQRCLRSDRVPRASAPQFPFRSLLKQHRRRIQ